jgi:epoxyqueuosine reductase
VDVDPKAAIRDRALELGFDAVGFAAPDLGESAKANLAEYLARGYHGDMGWLAERAARHGDPRVLWPEVKSVVVLGMSYAPAGDPLALLEAPDRGGISVYARGRDYHDTIKHRL